MENEDKKTGIFLSWVGSDIFALLQKPFGCIDMGVQPYKDISDQPNVYFATKTHFLASRYKFLRSS